MPLITRPVKVLVLFLGLSIVTGILGITFYNSMETAHHHEVEVNHQKDLVSTARDLITIMDSAGKQESTVRFRMKPIYSSSLFSSVFANEPHKLKLVNETTYRIETNSETYTYEITNVEFVPAYQYPDDDRAVVLQGSFAYRVPSNPSNAQWVPSGSRQILIHGNMIEILDVEEGNVIRTASPELRINVESEGESVKTLRGPLKLKFETPLSENGLERVFHTQTSEKGGPITKIQKKGDTAILTLENQKYKILHKKVKLSRAE